MPSESSETTETGAAAEVNDQPAVTSESASSSTPAETVAEAAVETAAEVTEQPVINPTALSEPDRIVAVGGGGFESPLVPAPPQLTMVERIEALEVAVFGPKSG